MTENDLHVHCKKCAILEHWGAHSKDVCNDNWKQNKRDTSWGHKPQILWNCSLNSWKQFKLMLMQVFHYHVIWFLFVFELHNEKDKKPHAKTFLKWVITIYSSIYIEMRTKQACQSLLYRSLMHIQSSTINLNINIIIFFLRFFFSLLLL